MRNSGPRANTSPDSPAEEHHPYRTWHGERRCSAAGQGPKVGLDPAQQSPLPEGIEHSQILSARPSEKSGEGRE